MARLRLDLVMVQKGLAATRSQAENYIKLGYVLVDGQPSTKPGMPIDSSRQIKLILKEQYVSRAALKLASVADKFKLNFKGKTVLDVGSSTGGFSDFALKHGAKKVIAVDVGTNQLHPSLRSSKKIDLHEQTDIRSLRLQNVEGRMQNTDGKTENKTLHSPPVILDSPPDIILIDVSFVSLHEILPAVAKLAGKETEIVAMLKPQFEAGKAVTNKGIVKNDRLRRQIIKDFELWIRKYFVARSKADSTILGTHGNQERFYLLKLAKR